MNDVDVALIEMNDIVNHPNHYTSGSVECIDALEAVASTHTNPAHALLTCQAMKYLWRWHLKNGVEDLRKAKWYIERLIEKSEEKND